VNPETTSPPFFEDEAKSREEALFHVIPAPYEETVSYGAGAALGPGAILEASDQLEEFDGTDVPAAHGVWTAPPVPCGGGPEKTLAAIELAVADALAMDRIPVLLGGEHTVTLGALRACQKKYGTFGPMGVVQFDAHADLRAAYQGTPYSHACVMRRAHELGLRLFQIGARAISLEEVEYRRENPDIAYLDGAAIGRAALLGKGLPAKLLPPDFPETVYVTFDVDGLDPSVIPATGTPVPGGLSWYAALDALQKCIAGRRVVGFDVVELAPRPGEPASDFAAAQLAYNMMGMIGRGRGE
jgi:agmatinase